MIVTLRDLLKSPAVSTHSTAGFNVFGLDWAAKVIQAAEETNTPVIIMTNRGVVERVPVEYIGYALGDMARKASVPVCLHLDHTQDFKLIQRALDAGYSSVMYDGSGLPLEENIANTRRVLAMARKAGASLEGEVGRVAYTDDPAYGGGEKTGAAELERFCDQAAPDAAAVSIGTTHRMTSGTATMDYELLESLKKVCSTPLVIHGSTGIAPNDMRRLSRNGIAKFNIGTALRKAYAQSLRRELGADPELIDKLVIEEFAGQAIKAEAKRYLELFADEA